MSDEARIFWCWRHGASANTDICDRSENDNLVCLITEAVVRQLRHSQSLGPLTPNAIDVTIVRLVEAVKLVMFGEREAWPVALDELTWAASVSGHLLAVTTPSAPKLTLDD